MKRIGLLLLCLLVGVMLTACATSAAPTPTPMTSPMNSMLPSMTPDVLGTPAPTDGAQMTAAMTGTESAAFSKKANDATGKISEIGSCVTAIIGNTCVAGVQFDSQYKGELTDRIRDMVASRIQSAVPTVDRVAVTSDPEISTQISSIADQISKTDALGGLAGELDAVFGKIQ